MRKFSNFNQYLAHLIQQNEIKSLRISSRTWRQFLKLNNFQSKNQKLKSHTQFVKQEWINIIDLWFSESNIFKQPTPRNLISLKRIPNTTGRVTPENEEEDPEDSCHLLTRRDRVVASFHFARRLTHISVEPRSLYFFVLHLRGQLCVTTRVSSISVRPYTRAVMDYNASRSSIDTRRVLVIPDTTFYIQVNSLIFSLFSFRLFDYYFW